MGTVGVKKISIKNKRPDTSIIDLYEALIEIQIELINTQERLSKLEQSGE